MTGRMCVICPVSSNTMTEVEMVCVTEPAMAAAPGRWREGERERGREGERERGRGGREGEKKEGGGREGERERGWKRGRRREGGRREREKRMNGRMEGGIHGRDGMREVYRKGRRNSQGGIYMYGQR